MGQKSWTGISVSAKEAAGESDGEHAAIQVTEGWILVKGSRESVPGGSRL